ncbi:hypothetical protein LTR48_008267, partial [Friedmanniomyces endolithicus]
TRDVVQMLYDASKHVRQYQEAFHAQQQLLHRRQQEQSPPQDYAVGVTPGMEVYNMAAVSGQISYGAPPGVQGAQQLGNSAWGLSPNGDTTMSSFWDDMMWDTIPELADQGNGGLATGLEQFDRMPMSGQGEDQLWTDWAFSEQQR